MKFTTTVFALLATAFSAIPTLAQPPAPSVLNYDTHYDNPDGLLSSTACSADAGILHGYKTFGSIPNFPHIAGSVFIEGFNSTRCGACYEFDFVRADGLEITMPFTIINSAPRGFIASLAGFQDLTHLPRNQILEDLPINIREVPSYDCGFPMN